MFNIRYNNHSIVNCHLTNFMRHLLLWLASLPPFISRPLALAMAKLATWNSFCKK